VREREKERENLLSGFLLDLYQPLPGLVGLGATAFYELLDLCSDLKIQIIKLGERYKLISYLVKTIIWRAK
jgi:hypothetical protein